MPHVAEFTPGSFSWFELMTPDAAAAKTFYSELLGWSWIDDPVAPGMVYHIATLDGREVAAMFQLPESMLAAGTPPQWNAYVSVPSVDACVAKVGGLGGKVIMPGRDVHEHGRAAIVLDSIGAPICLWQKNAKPGVGIQGEPGAFAWAQLNASDPEKAKAFYPAFVGWTFQDNPNPMGGTYTTWLKSDGMAGGMIPMPPGAGPSHWLIYWAVADVDASHAKTLALGGKSYVPPTDIPGMGRFAVMADSSGVTFAIVKFAA